VSLRPRFRSAEFRALQANASSPVTQWLRALARTAHEECGGRGVGAIGMCFTGNFALTIMLEPSMLASVLAQPSLSLKEPDGLEIAPAELKTITVEKDRGRDGDCSPPPGHGRRSPAPRSHRSWRADFPHHALRQLIHSTASACSSR
jgi:hypothetical protein